VSTIQPASPDEIRRYARGALAQAGAVGQTPAPLDQINAAVGLRPAENLFEIGATTPPGMMAIIKKLAGKVLGAVALPEKVVYLDTAQPYERRRFTHGHEIGHEVLPWHQEAYYADDFMKLTADTREALEQEANAFSAEILFGLGRFTEQADSYAPSIDVPLSLNPQYEVSAQAALRRYAERSNRSVALLALGRFPVYPNGELSLKVMASQCAQSSSFLERYGPITGITPAALGTGRFPLAAAAAQLEIGVDPNLTEITLDTQRGPERFEAGLFCNGRLRFALLYRRGILSGRRVRVVAA
jgi:hypothetical protein